MKREVDTRHRGFSLVALAVLTGLSLVGVAVAVAVAASRYPARTPEALLAGAVLIVALFPLFRRAWTTFDIFEPIVPATLVLAALFGGRPLVMIADRDLTYFGVPASDGFREAVVAGLVGTASFVAAHEFVWRPLVAPIVETQDVPEPPGSIRRATVVAIGFLAASIALFTLHLVRGPSVIESLRLLLRGRSNELADIYERSSEYLSSAPILAACGAIVVVAVAGRRRMPLRVTFLLVFALALPFAVFNLTGSRRFVIPTVLIPLVAWFLSRSRRPRTIVIAVLLPIAFVALATIPEVRSAGARENAGGVIPIVRDALIRPDRPVVRVLKGHDTEMLPAFALQVQTQDEPGDFFYGRATVGDVLLAPIPSLLIPSKPTTARDEMLTRVYGHPCLVRTGPNTGCADFSAVGTFYQDFWHVGVLVGMGGLGLATALMWMRFRRTPMSAPWIVVAASWFVFLPILLRAGFMPGFAWWLYFLVPSLLGLRLVRGSRAAAERTDARVPLQG